MDRISKLIDEIREYGINLNNWKKEIINSFQKHGDIRYSNNRLEVETEQ